MLYNSLREMVGNTPLLRLSRLEKAEGTSAKIYAKLEYMNPAGSAKDRVAASMLDGFASSGDGLKGLTVIEPTSGNTGIGLAALGASLGIRVIIVMPSSMSEERKQLIRAYGAELVLTDGALGMKGAIEEAERIRDSIEGSVIAGQFYNPDNPRAHKETTGPEIYSDLKEIDYFVAGIGTGGTVSGVGEYLKGVLPDVKVYGVEPEDSPLLTRGYASAHKIQGIGANFVPENLNKDILDGVIPCPTEEALRLAREIAVCEGVAVGISSGAALYGALQIAKAPEAESKTIVVLLPDGGERYLSSGLFD